MKLENQVSNKELSVRLKELGVKGKTLHAWYHQPLNGKRTEWRLVHGSSQRIYDAEDWVNAFTCSELGVMIASTDKYTYLNEIFVSALGRVHWVVRKTYRVEKKEFDNEADARAYLLIQMIENKIVTVDEINKRLEEACF